MQASDEDYRCLVGAELPPSVDQSPAPAKPVSIGNKNSVTGST